MNGSTLSISQDGPSASLRRHQSQCSICSHPQRQEVEDAWLDWDNTTELASKYGFDRHAFYRHAHALGLFQERQKQRKRLYEKGLERMDITSFSASAIVKLLQQYESICQREEAKQAASLPAQAALDPVSVQEAEVSGENGSPLEERAPEPVPTVESVSVAESQEQGASAVTALAGTEVQNPEPPVANMVQ